jgi:hypothetical protein
MTITYPAQVDTIISLPQAPNNAANVSGNSYNLLRTAVISLETALGANPAGTNTSTSARIAALENEFNNLQIIHLSGDLGGSLGTPKVISLQGFPLSNTSPLVFDVLTWNGIAWVPAPIDTIQGFPISSTTPQVGQVLEYNGSVWEPDYPTGINGATVPAAGALISGNVLQVTGSSTLSYAPINVGGGSNYVVGVLPLANLPPFNIFPVKNVSSNYQVLPTDMVINVVSAPAGITLEAAPVLGHMVVVKDATGTALTNNITISGNGQLIDGLSSFIINMNYLSISLIYTPSGWSII